MNPAPVVAVTSAVLAGFGGLLILIAGLGLLRMPDLLTRMHASSKAATLGAAMILLAVGLWFGEAAIGVRVALIVLFLLVTAPVATHVISRAGYRGGVPLAENTVIDEYRPTICPSDADGGDAPVARDRRDRP